MKIEQHELRLVLDPAGNVVGGSATTVLDDGGYRVTPLAPAPFDTPQEALERLYGALDIQLRLW